MNLAVKKLLVPVDFSDQSAAVLEVAEAMAKPEKAKLIFVHVVEPIPPVAATPYAHPQVTSNMINAEREKLQEVSPSDPSISFEHRIAEGTPSRAIVDLAESEDVDLIVMGTHGRHGLSRVLMGSVAEYVVRHAPCPVLTLKQPQAILQAAEKSKASDSQ